jgi:hypothetical protein
MVIFHGKLDLYQRRISDFRWTSPNDSPPEEPLTFRDVVVVIRAVEIEGEILGEPGKSKCQWIGLRENLQESPIFNGKIYGFL